MKLRLLTANDSLFGICFALLLAFFPLFVFGQVNPPVANYSTYCKGESMPISATSSTPNAQIEWYMDANINNTQPFTVSQNGEVFPLDSIITFGLGTNTVYAVASLGSSKSSSIEVPITINKAPVVIAIESDNCMLYEGDNVVFSPILENPNENYTYEWRKIKTKALQEITNPQVLSTNKDFSKSSLSDNDAGVYQLTVWNETRTCAAKIESPHLILRDGCNEDYPIPVGIDEGGNHAVLTQNLSSSYYINDENGSFNFVFEERYRAGILTAYLYSWQRCKLGSFTLNKKLGSNWYSLYIGMLAIPEASYVLEVFDENGTRTVAKFKFKVKDLQAYIIEIPSTYCKGWNTQFEGFIRGGIANYTTIWYTTTTPDNSPPSQNANWEILGWNKTERSRRPKMEFNTNLSKTHWVKTKVIDSRGCSSESTIYKIEPELSQEPIIDLNDGRERLSKAEYFQTESNSSLLKGVNIDSYYFKVNRDTTSDVVYLF
ncbi:immunoglobulin domain-containing protein [Bernardetia sp. ABR2-2B]|uniref:immunoglobulin domain-containing protein n=1 Tax=Bernardetia sp. ABR2-2B TaxID=3127472 RepID=UPI0030CF7BF8